MTLYDARNWKDAIPAFVETLRKALAKKGLTILTSANRRDLFEVTDGTTTIRVTLDHDYKNHTALTMANYYDVKGFPANLRLNPEKGETVPTAEMVRYIVKALEKRQIAVARGAAMRSNNALMQNALMGAGAKYTHQFDDGTLGDDFTFNGYEIHVDAVPEAEKCNYSVKSSKEAYKDPVKYLQIVTVPAHICPKNIRSMRWSDSGGTVEMEFALGEEALMFKTLTAAA